MQEMCWINFNMGCFEILFGYSFSVTSAVINFNMGCFEIALSPRNSKSITRINFNMGCFEIRILKCGLTSAAR